MNVMLLVVACGWAATVVQPQQTGRTLAKQPALIYKTKKSYTNLVPVLLSEDRKTIISYPAPTDIYLNGKLAYPTKLKRGYLLDNRGIGTNVAFLAITYQDYAKLTTVPKITDLYERILDKDPLLELYYCGDRADYKNIIQELNRIIKEKQVNRFKRLK